MCQGDIPFPISFIRVLTKLCIDERKLKNIVKISFLYTYRVSLHFILAKDEAKVVKVRIIDNETKYSDVTDRYGLKTSEDVDKAIMKCLQNTRKEIFLC